jgi:hypothetical protein
VKPHDGGWDPATSPLRPLGAVFRELDQERQRQEAAQRAEPARFTLVARPGTCIQGEEQHAPEDRVLQVIRQLPAGERLMIIREVSP